jgi:hypothetical protein
MRLHWHMTNHVPGEPCHGLAARAVDQAPAAIADSLYLGRSVQYVPIRRSVCRLSPTGIAARAAPNRGFWACPTGTARARDGFD